MFCITDTCVAVLDAMTTTCDAGDMAAEGTISIVRLIDRPDQSAAERAVELIFFASAGTSVFASAEHCADFRERWLGRYLDADRRLAHVALDPDRAIIGYVVGSHDDPSQTPRFGDIAYFAGFADVTARYPAHLHINLAEPARNRGIGGRLIAAFVSDVRAAGLPGVHVVTGRRSRNVGFYKREGFIERATGMHNGDAIVLLGRDVEAART